MCPAEGPVLLHAVKAHIHRSSTKFEKSEKLKIGKRASVKSSSYGE
jgi:hypothetical protein